MTAVPEEHVEENESFDPEEINEEEVCEHEEEVNEDGVNEHCSDNPQDLDTAKSEPKSEEEDDVNPWAGYQVPDHWPQSRPAWLQRETDWEPVEPAEPVPVEPAETEGDELHDTMEDIEDIMAALVPPPVTDAA
jgi:hypothetical protein